MTTIRSKVPVYLGELVLLGTSITIKNDGGPILHFKTYQGSTGHYHLRILDGQHGANALEYEDALRRIYEQALKDKEVANG